MLIGYKQHDEI